MRGRRVLGIAAVASTAWAGAGAASPAQADCVYATVYVTNEGTSPTWVNNGCVPGTGTPWKHRVGHYQSKSVSGQPHGTPNGYFLDVRVPLPG